MISTLFGYKKLIAWQKADKLAHLVYDLTLLFPKDELFGITSQLRRAVLSVPLNIVEGYGRNSKKEFHRFLAISLGSLAETEYLLEFAFSRGYIKEHSFKNVILLKEETGHIIWKLYISQK
jgi:four helix bundle protein